MGVAETMTADYEQKYWVGRGSMEPKHALQVVSWAEFFHPETVLDYGCGTGEYVHCWRDLGIGAVGFDISNHATEHAYGLAEGYCSVHPPRLDDRFELVTCYDVLEHLTEEEVDDVLNDIYLVASRDVLFSICMAGDPNFERDATHVLCRSKPWWMNKLSKYFSVFDAPPGFMFANQLIVGRVKNSGTG